MKLGAPRLPAAGEIAAPTTGDDAGLDAGALRLLAAAGPPARPLAVALARLVEDLPRLGAGRHRPLGVGFEDLFDERLERRFALLPDVALPRLLARHLERLLAEPDAGRAALEDELGRVLDHREAAWPEVERRVAMLRFVRRGKTDGEGHEVPFRFPEVAELLERWSLTARLPGGEARPFLWRLLTEDEEASALLPRVVERWERDFDGDAELVALARLVRDSERRSGALIAGLRRLEERIHRQALVDGATRATFRDLASGLPHPLRPSDPDQAAAGPP